MQLHAQSQSVHRFCQTLLQNLNQPDRIPQLLIARDDLPVVRQLLQIGFPPQSLTVLTSDASHHLEYQELGVTAESKDLRLWTPRTGQWDGILAPGLFEESIATQRVLIAFFQALKPQGLLWVDWQGPHWDSVTAHPLLRQSGFDVIVDATTETTSSHPRQGAIARRVGTHRTT